MLNFFAYAAADPCQSILPSSPSFGELQLILKNSSWESSILTAFHNLLFKLPPSSNLLPFHDTPQNTKQIFSYQIAEF